MGTALTFEWKVSTRMSQYMRRVKKALVSKQRHPMTTEHQRGGTYISNQVRMHALYTYFYLLQENPQKKSLARFKKKTKEKEKKREREKRIIELIIKENHCCDLGTERKMRRTLPLGNFQKKKKRPMRVCGQVAHENRPV
jgi:hypothetical protein